MSTGRQSLHRIFIQKEKGNTTQSRLALREPHAMIRITRWIQSPLGKVDSFPTGSSNSERPHKDHDLRTTVEGGGHAASTVSYQLQLNSCKQTHRKLYFRNHRGWYFRSQYWLPTTEDDTTDQCTFTETVENPVRTAQQEGHENRRVDPRREPSNLHSNHRRDDLVQPPLRELLVQEPEGDGDDEADEDGHGDDSISRAWGVQVLAEGAPGDGVADAEVRTKASKCRDERTYCMTDRSHRTRRSFLGRTARCPGSPR